MEEVTDRKAIRTSLSNMSFEELQKLKQEMGAKLYNEKILDIKPNKPTKTEFKRLNKNRPREVSSKRPTSIVKEIIQVKKSVSRDPRFDPLCGKYEEKLFKKNYKFLNKIKSKEKEALIEEFKESKDEKRKNQIKYLIQRMDNQQREESKREAEKQLNITEIKEAKESKKKGEKPVYQKKSEKRMMKLLNQYEELKESKKLKKHIEKKNKEIVIKEKIKTNSN